MDWLALIGIILAFWSTVFAALQFDQATKERRSRSFPFPIEDTIQPKRASYKYPPEEFPPKDASKVHIEEVSFSIKAADPSEFSIFAVPEMEDFHKVIKAAETGKGLKSKDLERLYFPKLDLTQLITHPKVKFEPLGRDFLKITINIDDDMRKGLVIGLVNNSETKEVVTRGGAVSCKVEKTPLSKAKYKVRHFFKSKGSLRHKSPHA